MPNDKRKYKGVKFINAEYATGHIETVEDFTSWQGIDEVITDFWQSNPGVKIWISQRPIGNYLTMV